MCVHGFLAMVTLIRSVIGAEVCPFLTCEHEPGGQVQYWYSVQGNLPSTRPAPMANGLSPLYSFFLFLFKKKKILLTITQQYK